MFKKCLRKNQNRGTEAIRSIQYNQKAISCGSGQEIALLFKRLYGGNEKRTRHAACWENKVIVEEMLKNELILKKVYLRG